MTTFGMELPPSFAALNVLDGTVIGSCHSCQRPIEVIGFIEKLDQAISLRRDLHLMLGNYRTHKHPRVIREISRVHPALHLDELVVVEPRGAVLGGDHAGTDLSGVLPQCAGSHKSDLRLFFVKPTKLPRPFIWTARVAKIMSKIKHCHEALDSAD
jgi:hypothetical protein